MRILGIGEDHCLGDLYRRLVAEGHEVRVHVACPESHGVMAGLVTRCEDWRAELDWIRAAGTDGVLLFETACHGEVQDALRRDGFQVIGGSAWGDRIENDRDYGQQVLRDAGLRTAATHRFEGFAQGIAFVLEHPGRYVYKLCDSHTASSRNYIGQLDDGADVIGVLRMEAAALTADATPRFVLMEHVTGLEVGVGAYFDGEQFLQRACLDWEHKRFFPGDLGELTGEMGTVVSYRGAERLFAHTLAKCAEPLRESGYCGYINLNLLINEHGVWPLEFTSRFGYPGYSICGALHREPWSRVFRRMLGQETGPIATAPGFSVGVVLTVPPFPYLLPRCADAPVFFREPLTETERANLHYAEIALREGQLRVSGCQGYAMTVTGTGSDVPAARDAAYRLVHKVVIPKLRYRNDIGARLVDGELARLARLGWYPEPDPRLDISASR